MLSKNGALGQKMAIQKHERYKLNTHSDKIKGHIVASLASPHLETSVIICIVRSDEQIALVYFMCNR